MQARIRSCEKQVIMTVYRLIAPDGKSYIGRTTQPLKDRFRNGRGYEKCSALYAAIQHFGWENFKSEILCECTNLLTADRKEVEFISLYRSNDPEYGYNLEGGGKHKTSIADSTRKILAAKSAHKHSPASVRKSAEGHRGLKHSEETKERMSAVRKEKAATDEWKEWHETMIGNLQKRVAMLDEYGEAIGTFESIAKAAKFAQVSASSISRACSGEQKMAAGYRWAFVDHEMKPCGGSKK